MWAYNSTAMKDKTGGSLGLATTSLPSLIGDLCVKGIWYNITAECSHPLLVSIVPRDMTCACAKTTHMSIKIHEPSTHQADMFSMEDALCASPQHYTRTQKDMAKVCSPCYTESRDRKITWTQVFKTSLEKKHTEYPIKTKREMAQMWLDSYINCMAMENEGESNIW